MTLLYITISLGCLFAIPTQYGEQTADLYQAKTVLTRNHVTSGISAVPPIPVIQLTPDSPAQPVASSKLFQTGPSPSLVTVEQGRARQWQRMAQRLGAASANRGEPGLPDLSINLLQQYLRERDACLVTYSLADPQSVAWVVTSTAVTKFTLPGQTEITLAAQRYFALVSQPPLVGSGAPATTELSAFTVAGRQLSDVLLAPLATQLTAKRLYLVADEALRNLPFAALPLPGSFAAKNSHPFNTTLNPTLGAAHEIVHIAFAGQLALAGPTTGPTLGSRELVPTEASAQALAILADPVLDTLDERLAQPRQPTKAIAAVLWGNLFERWRASGERNAAPAPARLSFARAEAEAVAHLTPGVGVLRATAFAATRQLALSGKLANYRRLHVVTHSQLVDANPAQSALLLTQLDETGNALVGALTNAEIARLSFNAELVVLSACESAWQPPTLQQQRQPSLAHSFLLAGASAVVGSRWRVNDAATALLMQEFYSAMNCDGLSPVAALRQAQRKLAAQPRWQHPYYWAGFVIEGNL